MHVELVIRDLHVRRDQGVGDALHEVGFDVVVIFRFRPDFQGEDERTCRLFGEHDGGSGIFKALAVFRNAAQDHVLGALIVLGVRHAEVEVEAARGLGGEVGELVRGEVGVGNADQLVGRGVDIGIHDGDVLHDTRCALAAYLVTHPKRARNENDDARGEVGQAALQGKTDGHAQRGDRGGDRGSFKAEIADIDAKGDEFDYPSHPRQDDDAQGLVHVFLFQALVELFDEQVGELEDDKENDAADDDFQSLGRDPIPDRVENSFPIDRA